METEFLLLFIVEWSIAEKVDSKYNSEMAHRWTKIEENKIRSELINLYVTENKTLNEVSVILGISESTVFQRLSRLGIKSQPYLKPNYLRKPKDVQLPKKYSEDLAEFFGIMLGDGHVSHFQVVVSLGNKEVSYAEYVRLFVRSIFHTNVRIATRKTGYRDVYFGSTIVTSWLRKEGLVNNKVKSQVDIPEWIFQSQEFMERFLRGFFDTDGSVYKLRFGIQISLTNLSTPLLVSLRKLLFALGYNPSEISADRVYLTRVADVERFFVEIQPKNKKHQERYNQFISKLSGQNA
ncbi:MAG: LAGLIDADG family homing endonuclease [Patescibacteria group bacterium]